MLSIYITSSFCLDLTSLGFRGYSFIYCCQLCSSAHRHGYFLCIVFFICSLVTVSRGFYLALTLFVLMPTGTHTTYNYYELLLSHSPAQHRTVFLHSIPLLMFPFARVKYTRPPSSSQCHVQCSNCRISTPLVPTTCPISYTGTPGSCVRRAFNTLSDLSLLTTTTRPIPMLKVRAISNGATPPCFIKYRNTPGSCQVEAST